MVGDSGKRPARRCLFGPVSHVEVDDFLSSLDMHNEAQAMEKWGFDFRVGRPLPGIQRYDWTPLVDAERGPAASDDMVLHSNYMDTIGEEAQASASVEELASELTSAGVSSMSGDASLIRDGIMSSEELSEGAPDIVADSRSPGSYSSVGGSVQADDEMEAQS